MNYLQVCDVIATYAVATIGTAGLIGFAFWSVLWAMGQLLSFLEAKSLYLEFVFQRLKERDRLS